tara:strand:+ start:86 stop:454 length:369 start_codon:yes stop_codon:yes gene_type:complete
MEKFLNISELAEKVGLIDNKGKPKTYIIRFWEKKFKEIRPSLIQNSRRYYNQKNVENLKLIIHLLKDQKLTIDGAKKVLKNKNYILDQKKSSNITATYFKNNLKEKTHRILNRIKKLKKENG